MNWQSKLCGTLVLLLCQTLLFGQVKSQNYSFEFYGGTFNFEIETSLLPQVDAIPSEESVSFFYSTLNTGNYHPVVDALIAYREKHQLSDWLYYQLIRSTAQQLSPKAINYFRYTLYKWFLLSKTGYDARLALAGNKIVFYVRSDEDVSDIPFFVVEGKKYICLNYHDYSKIDFRQNVPLPVDIKIPEARKAFSYKVIRMPEFKPEDYVEKDLQFSFKQKMYHFKIKTNPQIQSIFLNYPVVDFASYFNIPLSKETYGSLIPILRENVKGMKQKKGVDYLMRFTRYAFLYQDDEQIFGKEKRLSPEQTLFSEFSDCDDRAALFFYLVKEIYNLPMIALLYPTHITMAVQFDKPVGDPIVYMGRKYSICEPTPQNRDLKLGQLDNKWSNSSYTVVYQYDPEIRTE
ncbi:hypothetical protein [Desertivirga xinjiangensis]|uniref:hypothetical protein n=1 Tax=Desertivirga xinjiangensis TaxID=539206 RepID=UPI00210DD53B|nr:hypothetical protein [Pedobacter xinjiangensis]